MKIIKIVFMLLTFNTVAIAGPGAAGHSHDGHGHSHEISQDQAQKAGSIVLGKLVEKGKIENSWEQASLKSSSKKPFSGGEEWVVVFENKNVNDPKKQKLFIFLSPTGEYIAANFTGN